MRAWIATSVAALTVGCSGGGFHGVDVPGHGGGSPWDGIPGWSTVLEPPRNDIPPGSLIALWKAQGPSVICDSSLYTKQPVVNTSNPPIALSGDQAKSVSANLQVNVAQIVSASTHGSSAASIDIKPGSLTPVTLQDQVGVIDTIKNSAECKQRVATACTSLGATHFYIVTGVLKQTYDYSVSTNADAGASLDVPVLQKLSGSSATAGVGGGSNAKINVSAADVDTNIQFLEINDLQCPQAH
jgi:hypothetical protein